MKTLVEPIGSHLHTASLTYSLSPESSSRRFIRVPDSKLALPESEECPVLDPQVGPRVLVLDVFRLKRLEEKTQKRFESNGKLSV